MKNTEQEIRLAADNGKSEAAAAFDAGYPSFYSQDGFYRDLKCPPSRRRA